MDKLAFLCGALILVVNSPHTIVVLPSYRAALNADGKTAAFGDQDLDGGLRLHEVSTKKVIAELVPNSSFQTVALAFSANGKLLASCDSIGRISIWDIQTRKRVSQLDGHEARVDWLSFTSDSQLLVSASRDRTIRVWPMQEGKPMIQLEGVAGEITALAVCPKGQQLAVGFGIGQWKVKGDEKYALCLWDLPNKQPSRTIPLNSMPRCLAYSPDKKTLVSSSLGSDGVLLWDVPSLTKKASLGAKGTVLAFTSDNKILAITDKESSTEEVQIWDVAAGKHLRSLKGDISTGNTLGDTGYITHLHFLADNKTLLSVSKYKKIRRWDVSALLRP